MCRHCRMCLSCNSHSTQHIAHSTAPSTLGGGLSASPSKSSIHGRQSKRRRSMSALLGSCEAQEGASKPSYFAAKKDRVAALLRRHGHLALAEATLKNLALLPL